MRLQRLVAPSTHPVTLEEVTLASRVADSDENLLFNRWIGAATTIVENILRRQLCTATWMMSLDFWPYGVDRRLNLNDELPWWMTSVYSRGNAIRFPYPPLQSVVSVQYIDTGGTLTTWPADNYEVSTSGTPGLLTLAYGRYWPITRDVQDAIRITFVSGYGGPGDVPDAAKTAISMLVDHFDRNRSVLIEAERGGTAIVNPFGLEQILSPLQWGAYD